MPNVFRSGSDITITGSIFTSQFTIGINPDKIKGPTVPATGFYRIVMPSTGSEFTTQTYAVIAPKSYQGPSVRIGSYGIGGFNETNDLQSIAVQYGATGSVTGSGNLPNLLKWFNDNGYLVINFDYEDIVTDGLIGLYDPGYVPSYPFTGSTIYDLSGKGGNGTINGQIITGVGSFYGSEQGFIDFRTGYSSGSNFISTAVPQNYMDFTIVFKPTFNYPTFSNSGLMSVFATSTPTGNFGAGEDKSFRFNISGSGVSPTSSAFTIIGRNPGDQNDWAYPSASTLYINGVSGSTLYWTPSQTGSYENIPNYCIGMGRTNTTQGAFTGSFPVFIGSGGIASQNRNFNGFINLALFYDRVLSAAEQQKNYNALKGRFGM